MVLTGAKKICRRQNWFVYFISEVTLGFHSSLLFSSCLEWRYTYPLLEEAGIETWAFDILGWGFSDLGLFHYFSYVTMFIPFSLHFRHVFFSLSLIYIRETSFLRCGIKARTLLPGTCMRIDEFSLFSIVMKP